MTAQESNSTASRFKLTAEAAENIRRNPPLNLTVPEGAVFLGLGVRTTWELICQRKLKAVRLGGRTILRLRDLEAFLEKRAA